MFAEWKVLAAKLRILKRDETELRKEICKIALNGRRYGRGRRSNNVEEDEFKFSISQGTNYSIDEGLLKSMWSELSYEEKDAIKWKPTLVIGKFNKLDEFSMLMEAISGKPATATIKVTER